MYRMIRTATVGLLALGLAGTATAAELKPEEQIQYRQAGYAFMAWNMGKIKANLDGNYSQPQVQAAAETIRAIANSGMGALYGPGTDQNIGDVKTRVKPSMFTEREEVGRLAVNFINAANELAEVAALGDEAEVKSAFGAVGKSCKACHDQFRAD